MKNEINENVEQKSAPISVIKTDNGEDLSKAISETNSKNNKGFVTKRNIIIVTVGLIVSLIIMILTIKFALGGAKTIAELWPAMGDGFAKGIGFLWFGLLLIFLCCNIIKNSLTLIPRIKKLGIKISSVDYFLFAATIAFFQAVTPATFVTDPYCIYWLKKHGINTSRSAGIVTSNSFVWQIAHLVAVLPAFVIGMVNFNAITSDDWGKATMFAIFFGMGMNIFGLAFNYLICTSKRLHYRVSCIFNWFKKKLHMKYHTKPEIVLKYKEKAVLKKDFFDFMKQWKVSLRVLAYFVIADLLVFISIGFSLEFVNSDNLSFNFMTSYTAGALTNDANKILTIIPNAELTTGPMLALLLQRLGGWAPGTSSDDIQTITDTAVLLWRMFCAYIPALIGLICSAVMLVRQIKGSKTKKADDASKAEVKTENVSTAKPVACVSW